MPIAAGPPGGENLTLRTPNVPNVEGVDNGRCPRRYIRDALPTFQALACAVEPGG